MMPSRGYTLVACVAITLFANTVFAEVKPKIFANVASLSTQEIEEQLQVATRWAIYQCVKLD